MHLPLAQADIGFVMGSGTDIAMESADIILMNDDLQLLMSTIDLSKNNLEYKVKFVLGICL